MRAAASATDRSDLYWRMEGQGPLLLIVQSGDGDADRTNDLVQHLKATFTTIVYDRRGLSRSWCDRPAISPEDHAHDLHVLLAGVTSEPVLLLGCSLGALYGLHLAAAHPEQVSCVVAHDPATLGLLPTADRQGILGILDDVCEKYRIAGVLPAMKAIAAATGIEPGQETEPGVSIPRFTDDRMPNLQSFLARDIPGLRNSTLAAGHIRRAMAGGVRIVPAAGQHSRKAWNYGCAEALAQLVSAPLETFPGGHNGNTTHPDAFSQKLTAVLAQSMP